MKVHGWSMRLGYPFLVVVAAVGIVFPAPRGLRAEERRPRATLGPVGKFDSLPVTALSISPDGKTLATAGFGYSVALWGVETGKRTSLLKGHRARVQAVAFSPDGKTLASGSEDKTVILWDVSKGDCIATLDHTSFVNAVAFSPDGKTLASALASLANGNPFAVGSGEVRIWNVATGKAASTLSVDLLTSIAFSPDGRTLATGTSLMEVRLWDVGSGKERGAPIGHEHTIDAVAFSPDGKTLAAGCGDGTVKLWSIPAGKPGEK